MDIIIKKTIFIDISDYCSVNRGICDVSISTDTGVYNRTRK